MVWSERDSRKSLETYTRSLNRPKTEVELIQVEAVISFIKYTLGMTDGVIFMEYDSSTSTKNEEDEA